MPDAITTADVQQFKDNIGLKLQQRNSRFINAVSIESGLVGYQAKVLEQVDETSPVKNLPRHSDTPLIDVPQDARWLLPETYEWATLIDRQDVSRHIVNIQSGYTMAASSAMRRATDDEIIAAFFGDAKTGRKGETTTSFPSAQQIASGSVGMTVAKLKTAKKLLMAAEVDEDERLYVALSAEQHDDLLNETQAISLDYNTRPVLVDGRITSFMGFNFIHSERLTTNGSSERRCPAWAQSGIRYGEWDTIEVDIGVRRDKRLATQLYAMRIVGATRTEEEKVVEIPCVE